MQHSRTGMLLSDAPEVEFDRSFPLNQDCLHYIWSFLPNEDLIRCERVCKSWQRTIRIWSKAGLLSRFGRYRLYDDTDNHEEDEDAARDRVNHETKVFQRFKDLG
jgi:hypothetical protein